MLEDKIKAVYHEAQECKKNSDLWLEERSKHMNNVNTLCRAEKQFNPDFDKKAFLESLDDADQEENNDYTAVASGQIPTDPDTDKADENPHD